MYYFQEWGPGFPFLADKPRHLVKLSTCRGDSILQLLGLVTSQLESGFGRKKWAGHISLVGKIVNGYKILVS